MEGEGFNRAVTCSVLIDFSLPNKGKLLEFNVSHEPLPPVIVTEVVPPVEVNEPAPVENNVVQTITPVVWNPNVDQFPLNPEK